MSIPYSLTDNSISYFDPNTLGTRTIASTHVSFDKIRELLLSGKATVEELDRLQDIKQAAVDFGAGRVEIRGDNVYLDGVALHNALSRRMLEIMRTGGDIRPLANFQTRLMNNPSRQAVLELFLWVEKSTLPILADGRFVAYKKVRDDYSSYHLGKDGKPVYNRIGDKLKMDRNQVDDRREVTCSEGLHFCSYSYLPAYYGGSGRVVVLAIDPAHVVSIPNDYENAKGRAETYEVIGEVEEHGAENHFDDVPVVNDDLSKYTPEVNEAEAPQEPNEEDFKVKTRDGREFTIAQINEATDDCGGIRPAARRLGVAESSIRTWLAAFEAACWAYEDECDKYYDAVCEYDANQDWDFAD